MPTHALFAAIAAALCVLIEGCATTTVQSSGMRLQEPLCAEGEAKPSAVLYWMPQWRADQKEPQAREALVRRGIERFVSEQSCLAIVAAERWPDADGVPSNEALVRHADDAHPRPAVALLVVVRELGPRLLVGLPVLIEGGTEAVIDVRVLRLTNGERLMDTRTQWRNGGTFVIKGVGSLDVDLSAALRSAFAPVSPRR